MITRSYLTWLKMFCSFPISLDSHKPCRIYATPSIFLVSETPTNCTGSTGAWSSADREKETFQARPSFLFVNTNTCFFMWSAMFPNCRQSCCVQPVRRYQQTQNKSAATEQVFIKFSIIEGNK